MYFTYEYYRIGQAARKMYTTHHVMRSTCTFPPTPPTHNRSPP